MKETVGVVIATYNGECFIEEQIDSIIGQTLKPDLIIVVDDNSTDKTPDIIKSYSRKCKNIRHYQNPKNIGWIKNFERGISLCSTDYIALSDQDDIWFPDKLEKCIKKMSTSNSCGLCYHDSGLIFEDGKRLDSTLRDLSDLSYPLSKEDAQLLLLRTQCPVSGYSMFFHSDLKKYLLPFPGYKCCGHDWWISAISFFLYNPTYIESPLVYHRLHLNQASGAGAIMLENTKYALKKKIFDLNRIRKNVRREMFRLLNRKKLKAEEREDEENRRKEFADAFERLANIVKENYSADELVEKEVILKTLLDKRENLLSGK